MNQCCFIYIIPPLEGINIEIHPENSGWEKVESPSFLDCCEYKKQISHNENDWTIIYRKYKKIDAVSFIIKGYWDKDKKDDILSDIKTLFFNSKMECGAIGTRYYAEFILNMFENAKELSEEAGDFCDLFSERYQECELHCKDGLHYNITINYDSFLSKIIIDNIITVLTLSQIAYHFEPHIFDKKVLKDKLKISQEDVIKEFWFYKFRFLNSPISQAFPLFFKNRMSIIDNLLDYRNINLMESQISTATLQSKSLCEIQRTEDGILYLTFLVSASIIFDILSDFTDLFFIDSAGLKLFILICSIAISIIVFYFILPPSENRHLLTGKRNGIEQKFAIL